jgi:phage terminase large subunit GpA-like protein
LTGLPALLDRLADLRRKYLSPPPKLTVSEWADRNRIVPSYSAEPGPWRTDRTPYLREIMDALGDPTVERVCFMKCARIGGTEAGLNIIGYFIDQDPSPVMIVQPTVDDAKDFSKEQLAPSIESTPCLSAKVREPRAKDSGNTIVSKAFAGGAIFLVGANSPRGFRRRTVRVLDLEEIDGYPASAGTEGDQIKLAIRRTATFAHRRKIYMNSTPTLKGDSKIAEEYEASDQRRFQVPCPHCDTPQVLIWKHLRWEEGKPETAAYACESCGTMIQEHEKYAMLAAGVWVPTYPERRERGYHINALYSPWVSWTELVREWLEAQGNVLKLQVFINTALGEVWEERGPLDSNALLGRREDYGAACPMEVRALTAGVDVQDDRIEVTVWGWGAGEEVWRLSHQIIAGDPDQGDVWRQLDDIRAHAWPRADGTALRLWSTGVDCGAHAEAVYRYCKARYQQRVYAVRGASKPGEPVAPRKASRNNKYGCPIFYVGTDAAKDVWYARLRRTEPGAGYVHFDLETEADYLEQLTSERRVRHEIGGRITRRYEVVTGRRNEALDCAVYALAALYISNAHKAKAPLGEVKQGPAVAQTEPAPEPMSALGAILETKGRSPVAKPKGFKGGGWVQSWRR